MIILSGVLVVVAIALLVVGIVASNGESAQVFGLDALTLIYISIAVSVVSVLCLTLGVFLHRKELFGSGTAAASPPRKKTRPAKKAAGKPKDAATAGEPGDDTLALPSPPADVPDDALVYVVRGRKRYHLDSCRQLAGREKEELTYVEAKEEGFSSCTACLPDTALAARAAAGEKPAPAAKKGDKPDPKPAAAAKGDKPGGTVPAAGAKRTPEPDEAPGKPADAPALTAPVESPSAPPSIFGTPPSASTAAEPDRLEPAPAPEEPPSLWSKPAAPPSAEPDRLEPADPPSLWSRPGASPIAADPDDRAAEPGPAEPAAAEKEPEPAAVVPAPARRSAEKPDAAPDEAGEESPDPGPQVRILSGTKRYHRSDCALIEDIGDDADDLEALPREEAKARGCTPCLVCQPDREHVRD